MPRRVLSKGMLSRRLAAFGRHELPLLVMRLPELERLAWREGRAAALRLERSAVGRFASLAATTIRASDLVAHEPRSAIFSIVLGSARHRAGAGSSAAGCRSTLARASAALREALNAPLETGWTVISSAAAADLDEHVRAALERGALERQRYGFFSTLGHELRSPLTSIRGYLDTALDEELGAQCRRFLEVARSETLRLSRLVDGMFAISLLDLRSPGDVPPPLSARVPTALRDALAALGPRLRGAGVRVDLGEIVPTLVAIGHDELVRVLLNVLGNAVEHGRPRGTIGVAAHARGGVEILVDDDGPGIPPGEREMIFELGYRARCATGSGSGLGLALVRRIVERYGGGVTATASPLGGARLAIRLCRR